MTETFTAQDLMQSMQFTQDDLAANRNGSLGDQQISRLQALQNRALLIGVIGFFTMVLLATTFLYFGQTNGQFILIALGIFTTMINAIFGGMYGRQWMRLARDVRAGQVEVLTGDVERVIKADNRFNNFVLRLNDTDFYVKKEIFRLVAHEAPYRFYRAPYSKVLLAIEPLSG